MSKSIRLSLKGHKNKKHWYDLLGYGVKELKNHLESLFTPGMTWEKFNKGEIHIDHVLPIGLFEYKNSDSKLFKYCWGLINLRPL